MSSSSACGGAGGAVGGLQGLCTLPPLPPSSSLVAPLSTSTRPLLLFNKYVLLRKLGSGSFGDIWLGQCAVSGLQVAVKLEPQDMRWKQLCFESRLYSYMQGKPGMPRVYEFGALYPYYVLVMELLGPSLEDLFNLCQRRLSLKSVCMLADQLLQRLAAFHERSFLHRDVKPDNFLMGPEGSGNEGVVYMIDLGLAKKFRDMRTLQHFPYADGRDLTGTVRYTSINAHLGIEQSRRDDLESLGYMLLYFLRGSLPWQGMKAASKRDKYRKISLCKMSCTNEQLCAGQPHQLVQYLNYCRQLQFDQQPDYAHLRSLFREIMQQRGWTYDFNFDWCSRRAAALQHFCTSAVQRPLAVAAVDEVDTQQPEQQQTHRQDHQQEQQLQRSSPQPVPVTPPQLRLSSSPPLSPQRVSPYREDDGLQQPPTARDSQSPRHHSSAQMSTTPLRYSSAPSCNPALFAQQQQQHLQQVFPSHQMDAARPYYQYDGHGLGSGPAAQLFHLAALQSSAPSPLPMPLLTGGLQPLSFKSPLPMQSLQYGPLLLSPLSSSSQLSHIPSLPSANSLYTSHSLPLPSHFAALSPAASLYPFYPCNPQLSPSLFASSPTSTAYATYGGDGGSRSMSFFPPTSLCSSPAASSPSYSQTPSRSSQSPLASPHLSHLSSSPSSSPHSHLASHPIHCTQQQQLQQQHHHQHQHRILQHPQPTYTG